MLIQFNKLYPNIICNIKETDAEFVLKALETNKADIGLMRIHNFKHSGFKIFPIIDDELVLVTSTNHRFTKRASISLHEAANEHFYLLGESTFMYQLCLDECIKCGFFPDHIHCEIRLDTIQSFVKQGIGVTLLMEKVVKHMDDPEISIVRLKEKPIFPLALVIRENAVTDHCMRFIDFATSYFRNA